MKPPEHETLQHGWQQRLYLMGFLLCLLGLVGMGTLFLMPEDTPDVWPEQPMAQDEELTGNAGSALRPAPSFTSNGEPHNEGVPSQDTLHGLDRAQPPPIASTTAIPRQSTLPNTREQTRAERTTPPPVEQATVTEKGVGEITITALMPGASVNVADHVITEAPATLRVPWPANYAVAVHMGDATVYETQVRLTAENNRLVFAVDPMALD